MEIIAANVPRGHEAKESIHTVTRRRRRAPRTWMRRCNGLVRESGDSGRRGVGRDRLEPGLARAKKKLRSDGGRGGSCGARLVARLKGSFVHLPRQPVAAI